MGCHETSAGIHVKSWDTLASERNLWHAQEANVHCVPSKTQNFLCQTGIQLRLCRVGWGRAANPPFRVLSESK